jgi:hypothetical protein
LIDTRFIENARNDMINSYTTHPWNAGLLLFAFTVSGNASAADPEPAITLSASDLLPKELLSGANYKVQNAVINDGFMNIYTIDSKYGPLTAVSTATVYKRINEFNAMAAMEELEDTDEFIKSIQDTGKGVVDTATGAVTDPVGTVSGALSGVGRMISTTTDSLAHPREKSDAEGSSLASFIGKSKIMRQYAFEFGVDPYSRNQYLQEKLSEISQAGFLANAVTSIGLMAVPGAAGTAVGALRDTQDMNEQLRDSSPSDLRADNRKALNQMGIDKDIVDLFIGNSVFTPAEQTVIVAALQAMPDTVNRTLFVKAAVLTDNPDSSAFRQRQADMYAAYNRTVRPIHRFHLIGEMITAKNSDGTLIFSAPMDHLAWSQDTRAFIIALTDAVNAFGFKSKELWLSGTVSERARETLQTMGWTVNERVDSQLFGSS